MPVTVKIPLGFLSATGGRLLVDVEARTVAEALDAVVAAYPDLAGKIREAAPGAGGALRRGVRVFVGAQDIRRAQELATAVRDGDRVSVVAAISGG